MTILDCPPPNWKRPAMTKSAKLGAWERTHGPVHYDHRPPLFERKFDVEKNDTIPPANDPAFIEPITIKEHDVRTNGPGGEKRITSAGSDTNRRAKSRRISDDPEKWRQLLGPKPERREPPSRWPKRKFRTEQRR